MYFHSEGSVALYKKLYTLISSDTACTANNSSIRYPFRIEKHSICFLYRKSRSVQQESTHNNRMAFTLLMFYGHDYIH